MNLSNTKDFANMSGFIRNLSCTLDSTLQKWFLCFGSLLKVARRQPIGTDQDIDIGVIGDPDKVTSMLDGTFIRSHQIINDITGKPLKIVYADSRTGISVDLFFWVKVGSIYYHCIDEDNTFNKDGHPKIYTFKGIPAYYLEPDPKVVESRIKDPKYKDSIKPNGTWEFYLNYMLPGEAVYMRVPYAVGHCLDDWYGEDWIIEKKNYGMSASKHIKQMKSCKGLK